MSLGSDQVKAGGIDRQQRTPSVVKALIVALLLFAALVVALSVLRTGVGRIAGSTENASSVFTAGDLSLEVSTPGTTSAVELLFDSDGLYPGLTIERCLRISYRGSIGEVGIRLFGQRSGGTGLDEFTAVSFEVGIGRDAECSDFEPTRQLYQGTLFELWDSHSSFESGLDVGPGVAGGWSTTLRATAAVIDDDSAQGLDTEFWVVVEARP